MISQEIIRKAAYEVNRLAATTLPQDTKLKLKEFSEKEEGDTSKEVLKMLLEGAECAEIEQRPLCADVGCPRFYVKIGNLSSFDGGFVALEESIRQATADITQELKMRSNRCHPISRVNPGNNVGIFAPNVDYSFEPDQSWIELTAVHKGGAFGTDWRMMFAGDGIPGIKRFVLDAVSQYGRRGLACQPAIIGIGLGGTKDQTLRIAKEAACLRTIGDRHPDPIVSDLEEELLELVNKTGFSVMGYYGSCYALDVHIEIAYTHSAFLPIGIHHFCQATRRATARIYPDNKIVYKQDPEWFTPYYRREGVS